MTKVCWKSLIHGPFFGLIVYIIRYELLIKKDFHIVTRKQTNKGNYLHSKVYTETLVLLDLTKKSPCCITESNHTHTHTPISTGFTPFTPPNSRLSLVWGVGSL